MRRPVSAQYLYSVLKRIMECQVCHDENGDAYIKVPARSMFDLGAVVGNIVRDKQNHDAYCEKEVK